MEEEKSRDWAEQVEDQEEEKSNVIKEEVKSKEDEESKEKKEDSVEKEEESRPTAAVPGTWWCLRTCKMRASDQIFLIQKGDIITKARRSPTDPDWLIGTLDGRRICVQMANVEPLPPE